MKNGKTKWLCVLVAAILSVSALNINFKASAQTTSSLQGLTTIDTPDNETVSNSITVSGWALNSSGISRVDMYMFDNGGTPHWLGSVPSSKMTTRQDVKNVFPDYNELSSGFTYAADISSLKSGNYTLAVAGIGNDSNVRWETKRVTIGPSPLTCIDSPSEQTNVTDNVLSVSGWALNKSGISRVDMYAFDSSSVPHWLGSVSAKDMTARPDVENVFPLFNTLNSGYAYSADVSNLPIGDYTLAVAGIGNNGNVKWEPKTLSINSIHKDKIAAANTISKTIGILLATSTTM